ncbi:hypothetical protein I3843_03G170800 [Carya illinoinensis]|uniref:Uncharacterized protein n=1 Tax=Carya illinoinensis TaxID=32201 RepID=A0A8T1R4X7_CARIL|nr:hypothetical protein I3760_03G169700 [Carya illinoinensis]KAG6661484.1 hypothetical protein CIPAW_03G176600 [Carya illinoinensis]KAG6722588.1 hypothetical protein I3842_03G168300 [Carya illinoinensis]KAG7988105.1 hypothetical protein I3843_03G170800 [Carya illinoinensis]
MKKPGFVAASVAAASATAISASSCSSSSNCTQQEAEMKQNQENQRSPPTEKFAPRFDGLRFIETLVTAHR